MEKPTDPRQCWNGLIRHEDRRNVLTNAGADPTEEDADWDGLSLLARSRLTVFLTGRLISISSPNLLRLPQLYPAPGTQGMTASRDEEDMS